MSSTPPPKPGKEEANPPRTYQQLLEEEKKNQLAAREETAAHALEGMRRYSPPTADETQVRKRRESFIQGLRNAAYSYYMRVFGMYPRELSPDSILERIWRNQTNARGDLRDSPKLREVLYQALWNVAKKSNPEGKLSFKESERLLSQPNYRNIIQNIMDDEVNSQGDEITNPWSYVYTESISPEIGLLRFTEAESQAWGLTLVHPPLPESEPESESESESGAERSRSEEGGDSLRGSGRRRLRTSLRG